MRALARPAFGLPTALGNMLAALLAATALAAQEPPGTVAVTGTFGVPIPAEVHSPTPLNLPQVPKAALGEIPPHAMPPLPVVPGHLPQPNSLPATVVEAGPGAPDDLRFWKNVRIPFGASTCCPEPSVAIARDTAFATANTFGALSHDSGQTWRMVNPATRFPAVDNGVCCDQRVMHTRVSSERLTIWYMQYSRSTTTGRGSIRIAVAAGRDGLRSDIWRSWVFQPEHFGEPNGRWLDFPDISASSTHLFCSSNVFDFGGTNTNAVVWRVPLADLAQGGNLGFVYYTRAGGLGGNGYRFAQTSGTTMYWASHVNTATMRIYRLADTTTTASYNDRSVPGWSDATRVAPSPNGVNWIGRQDSRLLGGYNMGAEYGFLWNCAQDASHPFPFVRVARFRTSDHTLVAADDVWSSSTAFGYPGACTNGRGDRGVVLAAGSPTLHVRNVVFIVDQYMPGWGGQQMYSLTVPTRSPTTARWGDYFTCHIDDSHPQTFLCSGAEMDPDGNAYARYAWFSREADMPVWIDLIVGSTPIASVPIEVDVADRFGRSSGNTPFTRTYARNQGYRLTAPLGLASGGAHWGCVGWSGSGGTTTRNMIEVSSLGSSSDTMTANYAQAYEVTVNGPSTVSITVSPRDIYEASHGTPLFTRYYTPGTVITMTAPTSNGPSPFRRWSIVRGSTIGRVTDPTLVFTMGTEPASASAQYWPYTAGSVTSFGTGCLGSNGLRLLQDAYGTPEIGTSQSYRVQNALPLAPVWFIIGLSSTSFAGLPLPFDNAPIGAPLCFTYCSHDVIRATTATSGGATFFNVAFPNQSNLVGARIYTQYYALDTAANRLGLTMSNAYATVIGGAQQ